MNELPLPSPGLPYPAGISLAGIMKQPPIERSEARILLMHALNLTRSQLITHSERMLTINEARHISDLFQRRLHGEPIAYIIGRREFYGLTFAVTPDVLIPRPETELLVELALERLPACSRLLDMGTGSGAIAIAIAHARPDALVTALDTSAVALQVARRNAAMHGAKINFLESNWYGALEDIRFDIIVSNPPYIVSGDAHLQQGDLRFEPINALTDHANGMTALNTIIHGAAKYLKPGGWLLLEHGYDQSHPVRDVLKTQGFEQVQSWQDLAGIERVSGGVLTKA
jgi:release factor glutamine methyltransferase